MRGDPTVRDRATFRLMRVRPLAALRGWWRDRATRGDRPGFRPGDWS